MTREEIGEELLRLFDNKAELLKIKLDATKGKHISEAMMLINAGVNDRVMKPLTYDQIAKENKIKDEIISYQTGMCWIERYD